MDQYMANLVSLGILTKNNTTHTSPVMLVARKGTKNKRPVVDTRNYEYKNYEKKHCHTIAQRHIQNAR